MLTFFNDIELANFIAAGLALAILAINIVLTYAVQTMREKYAAKLAHDNNPQQPSPVRHPLATRQLFTGTPN